MESRLVEMLKNTSKSTMPSSLTSQLESLKKCGRFLDNVFNQISKYLQTCFVKRKVKHEEKTE